MHHARKAYEFRALILFLSCLLTTVFTFHHYEIRCAMAEARSDWNAATLDKNNLTIMSLTLGDSVLAFSLLSNVLIKANKGVSASFLLFLRRAFRALENVPFST